MSESDAAPFVCRLYLVTPPTLLVGGLDPAAFAPLLAEALDAGDVASLLLRVAGVSDDALRRAADQLRPIAQDRGVAFLLNDRPDLVAATGADGVHLDGDAANVAKVRARLGADMIVGASCDLSRHRAMVAAEQGADYVAFGEWAALDGAVVAAADETTSLVAWWSELMEVPCVALAGAGPEAVAPLADAGADFLAIGPTVWTHPDGAPAAIRAYNATLAGA